MKSLVFLAACAAALVAVPVRAASQMPPADSPRVTMTVENPMLVGDTLVKPGEYRFQCRHADGKAFLVISQPDGKEVVRVPCEQEMLPDKVANSELRNVIRSDGLRSLRSVRIKGEFVAHRLID